MAPSRRSLGRPLVRRGHAGISKSLFANIPPIRRANNASAIFRCICRERPGESPLTGLPPRGGGGIGTLTGCLKRLALAGVLEKTAYVDFAA
jgi:hypothetical protein